jgi:hypothetical protein
MLPTVRSPLGAPGAFALPEVRPPALHPQRMDVCAFVGVAPRGPARVPIVDSDWPTGSRMVTDVDRPLRRSEPVLVRSFDEYVQRFGAFEGPGLLPQAVASYFEQGGRLAWIVRIVHERNELFHHGCAQGALGALFTEKIGFVARSEGSWGNMLRVSVGFTTAALAFSLNAAMQIEVDLRAPVQVGSTLRLTDADGFAMLTVCEGLRRVRDPVMARERFVLELSADPPNPPARAELIEATIDISDGAGRREHFEHLALTPDHPQGMANVLCEHSTLVWPHPSWAGSILTPANVQIELLRTRATVFAGRVEDWGPDVPEEFLDDAVRAFGGGTDAWETLVADDFFDATWSAAEDEPGAGITALAGAKGVTHVVVPDLYVPMQWAGEEIIEAVPEGSAGAEFSECVDIPAVAAIPSVPPGSLTGLILDPRTQAGLDAIVALQRRVQDFCESTQNHIALLDVPPDLTQARIEYWRAQFDTSWLAGYHPWLIPTRRAFDPPDSAHARSRRIPPSAAAAGIVARKEIERGIQFGPANEIARQILHIAESQPPGRADALHTINVNCFVREPQGVSLIGARTLSCERAWRQLSVRRLMLMLRRALLAQMQWTVFEPNGPVLWSDIRRAIESLLRRLFRAGAFAGRTEAESFFVRLDTDRRRLDRGELLVEVGVAPAEPLEFILVRLRRDGDGTLNFEE